MTTKGNQLGFFVLVIYKFHKAGKKQRQNVCSKKGELDVVPVPAAKSSHLRRGGAMAAPKPPLTDSTQKPSLLLTSHLWWQVCRDVMDAMYGNERSESLLL